MGEAAGPNDAPELDNDRFPIADALVGSANAGSEGLIIRERNSFFAFCLLDFCVKPCEALAVLVESGNVGPPLGFREESACLELGDGLLLRLSALPGAIARENSGNGRLAGDRCL